MSEDKELLGLKRRREILALVLTAADAGEILCLTELHAKTMAAASSKHATLWYVNQLVETGHLERRWGDAMVPTMIPKVKSYVIPTTKAYRTRMKAAAPAK